MESNQKASKIFQLIMNILSWVVVAFAIGMMVFTLFSKNNLNKNDKPIFGYKFYTVLSDSMSKSENNADMKVHFKAGDVIIVKELSFEKYCELEEGEIIAFLSLKEGNWETVTHMIREREFVDGEFVGYETFGTNTGKSDDVIVEPGNICGVYAGKLPNFGHFFQFLRTVPGYILCILLPFVLIIGSNGIAAIRAFREYKNEQRAQMNAEREELAKEREETAKMMKELMELKAQLGVKSQENEKINDEGEE
jgi:hypothetical protein